MIVTDLPSAPPLDRLLRLRADINAVYEAQTRVERVAALRRSIVVGILLYNAYSLTSILLLPDIFWLSVALRALLVAPVSLALAWIIGHLGDEARERIVAIGCINAYVIAVFLFWLSNDPRSTYTFGELPLTLAFASMMLPLRFRFALAFTGLALFGTILALATKSSLSNDLAIAFVVQSVTACIFTLYANWRIESIRCKSFVCEFEARRVAVEAELRSEKFENLSHIDALTGLPNRRVLDLTLERWFVEDGPLAVLMIDVDFFKLFNDRLGHPKGDECLRRISLGLSDFATTYGATVVRFGGEEFTLLVQDRSELETIRLAGRLVECIRSLSIPHPARIDGVGIVTVSVGVSMVAHPLLTTPARLLASADEALYNSKQRGRNQWAVAEVTKTIMIA